MTDQDKASQSAIDTALLRKDVADLKVTVVESAKENEKQHNELKGIARDNRTSIIALQTDAAIAAELKKSRTWVAGVIIAVFGASAGTYIISKLFGDS